MQHLRRSLSLLVFLFIAATAHGQNGGTPTFAYERNCAQDASFNACYANKGTATRLVVDRPNFPLGASTTGAASITLARKGTGSVDCGAFSFLLTWNGPIEADDNSLFPNCDNSELSFATNSVQQFYRIAWFDSGQIALTAVPTGHLDTSVIPPAPIPPTPSIQQTFAVGNEISSADATTPFIVGQGTYGWKLFGSPSTGSQMQAFPTQDEKHVIPTGFGYEIDNAAGTKIERVTQTGVWNYGTGTTVYKTIALPQAAGIADGVQCTGPTSGTLDTSKPTSWTFTCTNNAAARISWDFPMPSAWDGGAVYFRSYVFSTTSQSGTVIVNWSGQCVRSGDAVANVATTGQQTATMTLGSQVDDERNAETAAVTLQGTCAGNAHLYIHADISTSSTAATFANLRFLTPKMRYAVTSRSDS